MNPNYFDDDFAVGRPRPGPSAIPQGTLAVWGATLCVLLSGCVGPWAPVSLPKPASRAIPLGIEIEVDPVKAAAEQGIPRPEVSGDDESFPADAPIYRGQSPAEPGPMPSGDTVHDREALPVSGLGRPTSRPYVDPHVQPVQYNAPSSSAYESLPPTGQSYPPGDTGGYAPGASPSYSPRYGPPPVPPAPGYASPPYAPWDGSAVAEPYSTVGPNQYAPGGVIEPYPGDYADLVVNLRETQTGRFMFGVGVNSDLGLTAQVIIDERNFDWRRLPTSLDDVINGTAWRGGGQALRIEAVPGSQVQRYLVNFTEPYLWNTPITFNVSGYLFNRRYFDWNEERLGGRIGFGYRITPDLSLTLGLRLEQVDFSDPRVVGIPEIDEAVGTNGLYAGKVTLAHDTRDIPFAPTEGHYLEMSFEQAYGTFDFPRGTLDYRRYFLLRERADRSGRHTLGLSFRGGVSGSQTPVYENFFAGGYSTLRGFRFRHASPKVDGVIVGGELSLLGSAEYIFPITADDMIKGAMFVDYGTIEEEIQIEASDFRVAVGAGLRVSVPAMGPAPIAIDLAIPIAREETDRIQNFSFFVGFGR